MIGFQNALMFPSLPLEINLEIVSSFTLKDAVIASRVSKAFHRFCKAKVIPGRVWTPQFEYGKSTGASFNGVTNVHISSPPPPTGKSQQPILLEARASPCFFIHNHQMYLFGGDRGTSDISKVSGYLFRCTLNHQSLKWDTFAPFSGPHPFLNMTETSCVVHKDYAYVVFGHTGSEYSDRVHRINIAKLAAAQPGDTKPAAAMKPEHILTTQSPVARSAHSVTILNGIIYVYGGWSGKKHADTTHSDFYALDIEKSQWEKLPVILHGSEGSTVMPPLRAHSSVAYNGGIYIFGGYREGATPASMNQVYRYDIKKKEWTLLKTTGKVPSGRSRAAAILVGKKMVVIGGWDRARTFADGYALDLDTLEWTAMPLLCTQPQARKLARGVMHHAVAMYGTSIVLYGGTIDDEVSDWLFFVGGPPH